MLTTNLFRFSIILAAFSAGVIASLLSGPAPTGKIATAEAQHRSADPARPAKGFSSVGWFTRSVVRL